MLFDVELSLSSGILLFPKVWVPMGSMDRYL